MLPQKLSPVFNIIIQGTLPSNRRSHWLPSIFAFNFLSIEKFKFPLKISSRKMAKLIINPDFKILKSCRTSNYLSIPEVELPCPTIATVAKENFIENVDREIVFIDDSIEIPYKPVVDKEENLNVVDGQESDEQTGESGTSRCVLAQQRVRDVAGAVEVDADGLHRINDTPKPLSAQITLPIQDFDS